MMNKSKTKMEVHAVDCTNFCPIKIKFVAVQNTSNECLKKLQEYACIIVFLSSSSRIQTLITGTYDSFASMPDCIRGQSAPTFMASEASKSKVWFGSERISTHAPLRHRPEACATPFS